MKACLLDRSVRFSLGQPLRGDPGGVYHRHEMVIDPAIHEAVYAPCWTLFRSPDGVLVLSFLLAVLGFGWLAWYFACRAFGPSLRKPGKALRRTAFVGRRT